jgi:hypothetical protein
MIRMTIAPMTAFTLMLGAGTTCGGAGPVGPGQNRVPAGQWGGQHVGMEVTDSGAELEFDCAHGRIVEPLALDASGRFDAKGTYTPEQPGPRREDESSARNVRYSGRVEGSSMTLTIGAGEGSADLGSFRLERGRTPAIRKCS